jgi:hypothetical protein
MWDLWWTKWHGDRLFSIFLFSPVDISPPRLSVLIYHLEDVCGSSSETYYDPLEVNITFNGFMLIRSLTKILQLFRLYLRRRGRRRRSRWRADKRT